MRGRQLVSIIAVLLALAGGACLLALAMIQVMLTPEEWSAFKFDSIQLSIQPMLLVILLIHSSIILTAIDVLRHFSWKQQRTWELVVAVAVLNLVAIPVYWWMMGRDQNGVFEEKGNEAVVIPVVMRRILLFSSLSGVVVFALMSAAYGTASLMTSVSAESRLAELFQQLDPQIIAAAYSAVVFSVLLAIIDASSHRHQFSKMPFWKVSVLLVLFNVPAVIAYWWSVPGVVAGSFAQADQDALSESA